MQNAWIATKRNDFVIETNQGKTNDICLKNDRFFYDCKLFRQCNK